LNPRAPAIHATVKLHKTGNPVRPIVYWKECPGYELAKALYNRCMLHNKLELPNAFKVTNSRALTQELANMEVDENVQFCSFDIENMYTNIPISYVRNIIRNIITKNNATVNGESTEILN
jgi:hypothetical protein